MIKIVLGAGHGPNTAGKRTPLFEDGTFMHEHEFNNSVIHKLKSKLNKSDEFSVTIVSSDVEDISLKKRVDREYQIKADLFLSVHANALSSHWGSPKGIESFYNQGSVKGEKYCKVIQDNLIKYTGLVNRGAKSAPGPQYGHSLYVLKHTYGPAVLVECGFMDNKSEAELLMSDGYRELVAESLLNSICSIFNVTIEEIQGYKIINDPTTTIAQMKQWAINRKADQLFIDLAPIYYDVAVRKGCDPAVNYCLSGKETGLMHFGGVLDKSYKNPCGLKTTTGGGDYVKSAHTKFDSWEEGIEALTDHLLLYAGQEGYPLKDTPDPRHFPYLLGYSPTVEGLDKWSSSKTYGYSLVDDYITDLIGTKVKEIDYKALYEEAQAKLDKIGDIL